MPDFNKYFLTVEKRTIKIALPPDKESLEAAFWAGFRYCEELGANDKKAQKPDGYDIFKGIFGKK
jgi:hypothetical protein